MRISLDVRTINVYPGMGRYCESLVKALSRIVHENEYVIFKTPRVARQLTDNPNFTEVTVDVKPLSISSLGLTGCPFCFDSQPIVP